MAASAARTAAWPAAARSARQHAARAARQARGDGHDQDAHLDIGRILCNFQVIYILIWGGEGWGLST